ncbi:hypothetical protein [Paraburkholderia youngii]|uniref:hypothetical protein n=1 Tax=Paraburkholderia youngii TaxID=2782701 RepID=UPI003D201036
MTVSPGQRAIPDWRCARNSHGSAKTLWTLSGTNVSLGRLTARAGVSSITACLNPMGVWCDPVRNQLEKTDAIPNLAGGREDDGSNFGEWS